MKTNHIFGYCSLAAFFLVATPVMKIQAQQIILDKPVKAGELTLFPEMVDENTYYYLPDKLRLGTDENGKPQFSFIKYVENVRSVPGEEDIREGTGGGIVHFVVSLSVTPEQIREAENELKRINTDGVVAGPVIYNSGTVSIISSFANTEGNLTTQVVGIGNAPLIDGQKAAVSMELTKKGAKLLWESFKMPTPDISFSFEMQLRGFRSPVNATIEADFDKIYKHHSFDLGVAGNYNQIMFGGEIELAFDDLRNNGAIKVVNMGSDEQMDKLIETAYNKLTTMMFNPVGTGNPAVEALMKTVTGKKGAYERASELYKMQDKAKSTTKTKPKSKEKPSGKSPAKKKTSYNDSFKNYDKFLLASSDPKVLPPCSFTGNIKEGDQDEWTPKQIKEVVKDFIRDLFLSSDEKDSLFKEIDAEKKISFTKILKKNNRNEEAIKLPKEYYRQYLLIDSEKEKYRDVLLGNKPPDGALIDLFRERVSSIVYAQDFLNDKQKEYILDVHVPDTSVSWDLNLNLAYVAWINRNGIKYLPGNKKYEGIVKKIHELSDGYVYAAAEQISKSVNELLEGKTGTNERDTADTSASKGQKPAAGTATGKAAGVTAGASKSDQKNDGKGSTDAGRQNKQKDGKKKDNQKSAGTQGADKKKKDFKMAIMATYQFKKIRQRGNFKIDLNKYTADKLLLRFDENIGQVNCEDCFKEVNLDDPMYKQREIVAMLDGFNYDDFGKYINYVNLKMKKMHENNDITVDEVRIDRENFMKSANNFKLMYGWKGDNDRSKWFDYEIQTQWSFFGGSEIATDWEKVNTNTVNLASPYVRKTIEFEADPEILKENKVRMVSVKLFYKVGDEEQVKQISLLPYKDQYSGVVDVLLPRNDLKYDYEISWRLYGNQSKSSGRRPSTESILFIDEL